MQINIPGKNKIKNKSLFWFYSLSFAFVLLNSYALYRELFVISALPFVLLIIALGIFSLDKLLLFIAFATPLSITLSELGINTMGVNMYLPTEPLLLFATILFGLKLLYNNEYDKKILRHPITIVIIINLFWIFITSIFSTNPVISFKFLLSRIWFIVPFFFIASELFKKKENINRFIIAYSVSLFFVVIYSLLRLKTYGMINEIASHWVMSPFYKDHTSYGAILAMFLPVVFALSINSEKKINKIALFIINFVFLLGLIFSYTRAAWISFIAILVIFAIIKLRIRFKTVFIISASILILFFAFKTQIVLKLEQNDATSNKSFASHVMSISNINNDDSNLERINRWNCALRMFMEKPVFGWGPGTYTENYAPFQISHEKTLISTNAGDKGNAHSEYLGPLSESGLLGGLTFFLLFIIVTYYGVNKYFKIKDKKIKNIHLGVLLGLISYFLHGFLNNFLDTDKASVPFWAFIAILVVIDMYYEEVSPVELKRKK